MKKSTRYFLFLFAVLGITAFVIFQDGGKKNVVQQSLSPMLPAALTEVQKAAVENFNNGNAKGLTKYYATEVSLNILEEENFYSASEAEKLLIDFFEIHPPKNFSVKHSGSNKSGKEYYLIGTLTTQLNENFRVTVSTSEEKIKAMEIAKSSDGPNM